MSVAADSLAVATDPGWDRLRGAVLIATLRDESLRALPLTPAGDAVSGPPVTLIDGSYGRLRALEPAAGGGVWVTTSNCGGGCTPTWCCG